MAEIAVAAFSAMSSLFATAAPVALTAAEGAAAVASAGAGAASWAAGTTVAAAPSLASGLLGAAQSVVSIGSMVSTLVGGIGSYQDSKMQARMASLDAESARVEAEQRANRIRREYVQEVGSTRVAFAASGLDISGGYAIEDSLKSQRDFQEGISLASGGMAAAMGGLRAAQYKSQGMSKLVAAAVKVGSQAVDLGMDLANRG